MSTVRCKGSQTVTRARTGNVGITYRFTVWEEGKVYRNDTNLTSREERIIDIAVNKGMSLIGDPTFIARKCLQTHTSDSTSTPPKDLTNNSLWQDINVQAPIITPAILTQQIQAEFIDVASLVAQHIQVKVNNSVIADMGGNLTYPLYLGGATPNTAITKINADGELITTKINATGGVLRTLRTGKLSNPFEEIDDDVESLPIDTDNVRNPSIVGLINCRLDWTTASSGRRQTIVGPVFISVPSGSGKYFYENGKRLTSLYTGRECVELLGYGDETNFYGWIVTNRTYFHTDDNKGSQMCPLAIGRVNGIGSVSFDALKVSDDGSVVDSTNHEMKVVHTGTPGHYYLYCPKAWFPYKDDIYVDLTGYGYAYGSNTAPIKASVGSIVSTTLDGYDVYRIEVVVSDDDTPNDGSFFFKLYNMS